MTHQWSTVAVPSNIGPAWQKRCARCHVYGDTYVAAYGDVLPAVPAPGGRCLGYVGKHRRTT